MVTRRVTRLLRRSSPGDDLELVVVRDGSEETVMVTLGSCPKRERRRSVRPRRLR